MMIVAAAKVVFESLEWVFRKLGLEFKWLNKEKEDHALLMNTIEGLKDLRIEEDENIKKLIEHNATIDNALSGLSKSIEDIIDKLIVLQKDSDANEFASREALADRINQKYKYYIELEGIPEDEYEEFVSLHKAYNGVGGNHTGDAKFEYCINNLKMIPVNIKLNYDSKNRQV